MSLNNLVDNILQIARNNNVAESEQLSRAQVEQWILAYRAMLVKQQLDKGVVLNDMFNSTITDLHISRIEPVPGHYMYVTDEEIPKVIGNQISNIKDMFGNLIQIGSQTKAKYQKYRKASCKDYIAWIKNNKVYVEGGDNTLEYINIDCVLEDPTTSPCFDPDGEFPVAASMVPTINELIMTKELGVMVIRPSDTQNNAKDDNQNVQRQQ